jgi:hypothetical protein
MVREMECCVTVLAWPWDPALLSKTQIIGASGRYVYDAWSKAQEVALDVTMQLCF